MTVKDKSGGFELTEPIIEPVAVGSFGGQDPDTGERDAFALTITLDPDELRGLGQAFERSHSGEALDVVSQWRVGMTDDPAVVPPVFLYVSLPQFAVAFNVR